MRIHISNNMKIYPLKLVRSFRLERLAQVVFLFSIWSLAAICSGAPLTNNIPWSENFENYATNAALINGTNGWYSYPNIYDSNMPPQTSIVQNVLRHSGTQAVNIAIGDTLSNSFVAQPARNVKLEMYIQPQLMTSSVYPFISTNSDFAAQFFINSNGYFVVANGTTWNDASNMPSGEAISITNINNSTNFVRVQIHLQYNTHMWGLKAWTNGDGITDILVASTNNLSFTSNLNYFTGLTIYNGTTNSYLDDVTVRLWPSIKVNGVSLDTIKRMNGVLSDGKINGVDTTQ